MKSFSVLFGAVMWFALVGNVLANDVALAVEKLSVALLAGDESRIRALFDLENGGYAYSLDGALHTGDSFAQWLESDIIATGRVFVIDNMAVEGRRAIVEATYGIGTPTSHRRYAFEVNEAGLLVAWRIEH